MRQLTKKQKNILDRWFDSVKDKTGFCVCDVVNDKLPIEIWETLVKINDTEILYQNVNKYINDKAVKEFYELR